MREIELLSSQQAFNSFTINDVPFSKYVHRIRPDEVEKWFSLLIKQKKQNTKEPPKSKGLRIEAEVAGATILLKEIARSAILVDPGPYISSINISDTTPSAILLTHAHKDHVCGLSWALEIWKDVKIVMSSITRELLIDQLHRNSQYALADIVSSNMLTLNDGDKADIGRFEVTAYQSGHCIGGNSYFIRQHADEYGVFVVGEFSRRSVGGFTHSIPTLDNVHTLFIEAIHADDATFPTGVFQENYNCFIEKLEEAYSKRQTIVIATSALAEMQEVYNICAMHQRSGGLPEYPLVSGNTSGVLKILLARMNQAAPWDIPIIYTDDFEFNAINILTCSFDPTSRNSHFWSVYDANKGQDDFAWFFPQRYNSLKPEFAQLYDAYTHASITEIIQMILDQDPLNLCLYSGGVTGSRVARLMSDYKTNVHDVAGGAGRFKL